MSTVLSHFLPAKFSESHSISAKALAAQALHSVLLGAVPFTVLYLGVVIPLFVVRKAAASAMWAVILVITIACMFLLRRGYIRLSGWVFLSAAWMVLSMFVALSGGIASPALLSHIAVIVVAAWLVGRRSAIWIAAISLLFDLGLAIIANVGVRLPTYFPAPPVVAWMISAALVSLAILPLVSVSQALTDSAEQAQRELEARRREERAREESEERFRATFFQAAVGITQTGIDGRWMLLNDRLCEMLGYSQAELHGKTFLDITHPDDREISLTALNQLLAGEIASWSREKRYIRKDGATVWARVFTSLVRDQHDKPQYFITVVEDVTERIQAERALRDSEQRLTLAQNAAYLGVWDRDMRTDVITICGKYAELLGLSPDRTTLPHDEWVSLIHPDDRERVHALRREARERTHAFDAEFRVIWPNGSVHWLHAKGTVLLDESSRAIRSMGVLWDISERKQAEDRLRESEERFRNMADSAPVMIWVSGLDKLCTFFNKPWLEFTGRTMDQELGNGWAEGVHPEDFDRCFDTYNSSFDARRSFQIEYRLCRADGKYRWILDHGTPLCRGGEFVGFIGSCVDITERKLIEERVQASEAQLMDAQRLAKVGSFEVDIASDTIYWSDEIGRIFGTTGPRQSDFQTFLNFVHPRDRDKVLEGARTVRSTRALTATPGPVETHYRIIRNDGEVRFLRSIVEAVRSHQGVPVRLTGATQDITEQVRAQELLRKSEQRLQSAERLAQLGHWWWDLKNQQIIWSEGCYRIFGQPRDFVPSYDVVLQMLIPEDRERVEQGTKRLLTQKDGVTTEFRIVRPDGKLRVIRAVSELSLDDEDNPVAMFGTCQDITDTRRAQEEAVARQKLESVGRLASGIAHDFNNLLGGVLAQAELGLSELAAGSNPEAELNDIRKAALRGSEIVRELMIYAGKERAALELVDVSRIVKEMFELLTISISKKVALQLDLAQNLPRICSNAGRLRQVVMNLIMNASEAIGDRDGVIRVTTCGVRLDSTTSVATGPLHNGEYVQLEVSDTGSGIPLEMQSNVFDPFFTTKSSGHGLGLAIVDGIVRSLGGAIQLTSKIGNGTTFQILFPCAQASAVATSAMSPIEDLVRTASDSTVLVVEDEHPLRLAVTKMLRQIGYEVFEAADGTSAIDLLREKGRSFDAILLDITIPGASSAEIVTEALKTRPEIRVILMSAYSQEMLKSSVSAPQVRSFIRKPFQFGDLVKVLQNALST